MSTGRRWTPPSVDRPVATFMVVAAVVVFGYVSFQQMPVDLMPELSYPTVTVRTTYDGAAPEEVEDEVVEPMEDLLRTVEGVVGVSSISRAGSGDVVLRFQWDTSLDFATQKVRERIGLLDLPDAVEPPLILRYDPTLDPILRLAVTGDLPLAELRHVAEDELQRELEKVEGVAMVRVFGGEEAIVRVSVDERRLEALQLDIAVIAERLRSENVNVAGGRLYEGEIEYLVRTVNEFGGLDDIGALVVAVRDGGVVRLRDVATIENDVRDREVVTRVDGRESIEIAVFKEADANLVSVAEAVKRAVFGAGGPEGAVADSGGSGEGSAASTGEAEGSADGSGDVADQPGESEGGGWAATAPDGLEVVLLSDQSAYIRAAIAEVVNTAVLGGLCAVFVLFIFLRRPYATAVIGLAIPLSVVATFAPMRWLGVSLNVMSLGGLALGIGMLVDNAIVVLESIVRCREEGDVPRDAALRGTREVAGAVAASTLTTVAVFFPIVFVEGIAGQLFGDLAVAVVLSLLASLAFALFFVPMMFVLPARRAAAREEGSFAPTAPLSSWRALRTDLAGLREWARERAWRRLLVPFVGLWVLARSVFWVPIDAAFRLLATVAWGLATGVRTGVGAVLRRLPSRQAREGRPASWFERGYGAALGTALRARLLVAIAAVLALGWAAREYQTLGLQLIPELQQGEFTAEVRLPVGTQLEETALTLMAIEAELVGDERVERVATFIGRNEDDLDASDQGEHYAELTVVVRDAGSFPGREAEVVARLRDVLEQQPALDYEIVRPTLFSLEAPIAVEIRGDRLDALAETSRRVERRAAGVPGLADVRSNMQPGFPEVRVRFDRERLAMLGLDVRDVAEVVRDKVQGAVPTELRPDERSVDVELRVDRADVATIGDLSDLIVGFVDASGGTAQRGSDLAMAGFTGAAERRAVRLGAVAEIELSRGPSEIRHLDGQRAAVVTASSSVLDIATTVEQLEAALRELPSRPDQIVRVAGQSDEMEAAQRSLGFALLLAVFLVYVVMASNFESLMAPLVILFSIPLALVGVVAVLEWTATPLSVVVFIGAIVLAGIVVNNAIVLVDTVLLMRRRGLDKRDAIVEAGRVRLRPVLITATTTMLGLLPMALGFGEGAEIRRPLAWVVIAGLGSSTLLTLVIIPVIYDAVGELFGAPLAADEVDDEVDDDDD